MINPLHVEEAIMFANYILENRTSMTETAKTHGVSSTTVSSRISLLKLNYPDLYEKAKTIVEEIKLEKVRANGKKNALRTGFRSRGNYNF